MNKRPKPGEDEDDLLKFQQEFLSSGASSLSVSLQRPEKRKSEGETMDIVNMKGMETGAPVSQINIPEKKSKLKTLQGEKVTSQTDTRVYATVPSSTEAMDSNDDIEQMMDRKDTGFAAVLSTIIERDTRNEVCETPILNKRSFPCALPLDRLGQNNKNEKETKGTGKKKSLFAQQVEKQGVHRFGIDNPRQVKSEAKPVKTGEGCQMKSFNDPQSSYIVDGKGLSISNSDNEAFKIHQENLERLSSMQEEEILEEQKKLLNEIDPKTFEFLKNKRRTKDSDGQKSLESSAKEVSFSIKKGIKRKEKSTKVSFTKEEPLIPPNKHWLHMDQVERDKMEWMKDLPAPTLSIIGRPARFDFRGDIMAADADVPVNLGLHHHGDEPERAGYSLEELFQLARSSNLQQRCLSLHTLARIISKAKSGSYVNKIESPILPAILSGGVIMLLRWALDDTTEAGVAAAIDALHALICQSNDEDAIDRTWSWYLGHTRPSLIPTATLEKNNETEQMDEENKEEETDADVSKRDIVLALVTRMDLLIRLRYVLNTMKPQAVTVMHILSILSRIAQHSLNLAYEVTKCKGLLDLISQEFIPTAWEPKDKSCPVSYVHGLPVPAALRLCTSLCQAGRHIASTLVSNYQLNMRILRYLAVPYSELQLPIQEALNLQVESLALWRVTAAYGFNTQTFFDLYTSILPCIGKIEQRWHSSCSAPTRDSACVPGQHSHEKQTRLDVGLVCVLEQMLNIVDSIRQTQGQDCQSASCGEEQISLPNLTLGHLSGFAQPMRSCIISMLSEIGTHYTAKKHNLDLPTGCLNFLASYINVEAKQSGVDEVASLEHLELLAEACLVPLWSSYGLTTIIENLCTYSNILDMEATQLAESSLSLPCLNAVVAVPCLENQDQNAVCACKSAPILEKESPFGFLVSLLRLVLSVCWRHKGLINQLIPPIVQNKELQKYVQKICHTTKMGHLSNTHFTRTENLFQYLWLKCCVLMPGPINNLPHKLCLQLLSRIQHGDEYLAHDLMSLVVFSPKFFSEGEEMNSATAAMASMTLSETFILKSATMEDISISKNSLLQNAISALATIRGHFLMAFAGLEKPVQDSRNVFCGNCYMITSLMSKSIGETLMPRDWTYMPLIHVYNQATHMKSLSGASMSPQAVAMVTSVLQWNYLLEEWRALELENFSVTVRLSRVMCTFLAGSDLFLEKPVHQYLAGLIRVFTSSKHLGQLDFEEKIPGVTSFYDLYQEFLEQYEAVSFGDPVFGLYLLLPMQQRHSSMLRRAVFGERRKILRTLRLPLKEMLIPVDSFVTPDEDDPELIQMYVSTILAAAVQPSWSPVMYLLAVHHVNRFLFLLHDEEHRLFRSQMWSKVLASQEKMSDVIFYKQANLTAPQGMEQYDVLPPSRQTTFEQHVNR